MTSVFGETGGSVNVARVTEFLDAVNALDSDKLRELTWEDDFEFRMPFRPSTFPEKMTDRDELIALNRDFGRQLVGESLNHHDYEIQEISGGSDWVIAVYACETALKKTRGAYRNSYVALFHFRDGRIDRFVEYFDPIPLVELLGGSVEPPPVP